MSGFRRRWNWWTCTARVTVIVFTASGLALSGAESEASDDGIREPESARVYDLDRVVITAERWEHVVSRATGAVSVLGGEEVSRFPVLTLTDALRIVPGMIFVNRDGLGRDAIPAVRGFYGGGEVEYVRVLLDGHAINHVESGLVDWNAIPLASLEAIEVVRGGASPLHGDSALGGVINLLTKTGGAPSALLSFSTGGFGAFNSQLHMDGRLDGREYGLYASEDRIDGFRDHAERVVESFGGSYSLLDLDEGSLALSTTHRWMDWDDPGPLSETDLLASRTRSSPFYRFDHTSDRTHFASLKGELPSTENTHLTGSLFGGVRRSDSIRTLPLTPEFADTKERVLTASRVGASVQTTIRFGGETLAQRVTAGVDVALHSLSSTYYLFFIGGSSDYRDAKSVQRGDVDEQGDADRRGIAGFLQYELLPTRDLKIVVGGRADVLRDAEELSEASGGTRSSTTHSALSPKVGMNFRFVNGPTRHGNVYANVSRSFKAPTLDQLYDRRSIPVEDPPFKVFLSSSALSPQFGTSVEVGLYHHETVLQGRLVGEASVAAYRMDMHDELDFDLDQFAYVNIGESRHTGVESSLKFYVGGWGTVFANHTMQSATSQFGRNAGKRLKAIPRHALTTGISIAHPSGLGASLLVQSVRDTVLDDANTIDLPDYTTADAKITYAHRSVSVAVEMLNVFDLSYSPTGFPDPGGSGIVYVYPAAGRSVRFSVRVRR